MSAICYNLTGWLELSKLLVKTPSSVDTMLFLYPSMIIGNFQSSFSLTGILLQSAFLKVNISRSRTIKIIRSVPAYFIEFCFLSLGLMTAKKLLAAFSQAALKLRTSLADFCCRFSRSFTRHCNSAISLLNSGPGCSKAG